MTRELTDQEACRLRFWGVLGLQQAMDECARLEREGLVDGWELTRSGREALAAYDARKREEIEKPLRERIDELVAWQSEAVANCAKRNCSGRDRLLSEAERDLDLAREEIARMRKLLADMQWCANYYMNGYWWNRCPKCERRKCNGHAEDCALARELREDDTNG